MNNFRTAPVQGDSLRMSDEVRAQHLFDVQLHLARVNPGRECRPGELSRRGGERFAEQAVFRAQCVLERAVGRVDRFGGRGADTVGQSRDGQCDPLNICVRFRGGQSSVHPSPPLGSRRVDEPARQHDLESAKSLTQALRRLERNGLVERRVLTQRPVAVEYRITPLGRTLEEPFSILRAWTADHLPEVERHRAAFDEGVDTP
ncbi:winged helix-turn-helix transcriptional regulator [Streptomyces hebeiensis]